MWTEHSAATFVSYIVITPWLMTSLGHYFVGVYNILTYYQCIACDLSFVLSSPWRWLRVSNACVYDVHSFESSCISSMSIHMHFNIHIHIHTHPTYSVLTYTHTHTHFIYTYSLVAEIRKSFATQRLQSHSRQILNSTGKCRNSRKWQMHRSMTSYRLCWWVVIFLVTLPITSLWCDVIHCPW